MRNTTIIISETTYGKMIKERRLELGYSGEYLAELCNRSEREIRNIEACIYTPKLDTVLNLAYALNMDIGDLNCLLKGPYASNWA